MDSTTPMNWVTPDFPEFVLDNLPMGLLTVDSDLKITFFNPAAEYITGYARAEALGQYCGEVLQGGQCQRQCPLRTVLSRRQTSVSLETNIHTKDGRAVPVRLRTAAMFNKQGELVGALEAFADISQLKGLEAERTQTLSIFAHDMKAPLIAIDGFASRLLDGKAGQVNDKQASYLRVIKDQSAQVIALVLDFLDVARLGQEGGALVKSPLDPMEVLASLEKEFQYRAESRNMTFAIRLRDGLPEISGDVHRLKRAVINLLDNAVKYSGRGEVLLQAWSDGDQSLVIEVLDQGPGLTDSDLKTIFKPFERGSAAKGQEGTGLGLAAVRLIAEAHGGSLEAGNRPEGGAYFRLILPTGRD